ncbi:MAG TPA: SdrD B-like domain-containing protein [Chloroflexota bacterium]|nr:SdrD B-like domain-containing protein [Chloroflexota bacterium]
MRAWIVAVTMLAWLGGLPTAALAAPTPIPTATPKPQPAATPTQARPAPTPVPPPTVVVTKPAPAPTPPPAVVASPTPTAKDKAPLSTAPPSQPQSTRPAPQGAQPAQGALPAPQGALPAPQGTPAAPASTVTAPPTPGAVASNVAAGSAITGAVFVDLDANGLRSDGEPGVAQVDITLTSPNGLTRTVRTTDDGTFSFPGLTPDTYRVAMTVPAEYVATTDAGSDVDVAQDTDTSDVLFGLLSLQAAGLNPDGTPNTSAADQAAADDEQIIALASVSSLPLRFAEGRDLMAQVQRRVLGDGLVWLGVPFRSQIDGGDFQYVNCGPASLTMVLAGFGLEVGPSQVRDYLNSLIDNFNTDLGTSLDVLAQIGKDAGLTPMDLYSDNGGYRNWSTDAVRWHVQQGHPVLTLVKYRNLPGHSNSLSEFDHYIVISGLTPNGFIYNDAAFSTTLGYGLEISDVELEYAWDNSSIPHHALALGLAPDKKALTFPELPRRARPAADSAPTTARAAKRLAQADEVERAPLTLVPTLPVAASASVAAPTGPLITAADRWQDDPNFQPLDATDPGAPMGLNMEQTDTPTLEPRPGPGTVFPKLLTLIGSIWLLWAVWSLSGRLIQRPRLTVRRRPLRIRLSLAPLRAALSALLSAFGSPA